MKSYLITSLLIGSLAFVSCKDHKVTYGSASDSEPDTKIPWPPVSEESVSDKTVENYLVVLDDSGSMEGKKMRQAREALISLSETLDAEDNLGLMMLNDFRLIKLDSRNRENFVRAVNQVVARGSTPLTKATQRAFVEISEQAGRQQGYGSYHIIIVTDGESGDGSPMEIVKEIVSDTAVQVHVIGFHLKNHEMNDDQYVDYHTAKNADELVKAFEAVAAETNEFSDPKEFTK